MAQVNPTAVSINDYLMSRWSPYVFDPERDVSADDLRALFEAARWTMSSFNAQPWRYIVGAKSRSPADLGENTGDIAARQPGLGPVCAGARAGIDRNDVRVQRQAEQGRVPRPGRGECLPDGRG